MQSMDLTTALGGRIALTSELHAARGLMSDESLYKFLWIADGTVTVSIDHVDSVLSAGSAVTLSPLQKFGFGEVEGTYRALLFNSSFYCIFGHDDEVSCNGLLFNGSSQVPRFDLSGSELGRLETMTHAMLTEYEVSDGFREEMLRMQLKHVIIFFTRIARQRFGSVQDKERAYETARHFYMLVDSHFREKKLVQDYASMLNRSPKTLTNLFYSCGLPSPLKIIHDRVEAEAKRLLVHTGKSAKEIAALLGFDDQSSFSRFFRKAAGQSVTEFRRSTSGHN